MSESGARSMGNAAAVARLFRALGKKDPAAALAEFVDDLVVHEPPHVPYAGDWVGRDGFANLLRELDSAVEVVFRTFDLVDSGDKVVVRADAEFTARASGSSMPVSIVEVYHFRSGKICEVEVFYRDPSAVAELLAEPVITTGSSG